MDLHSHSAFQVYRLTTLVTFTHSHTDSYADGEVPTCSSGAIQPFLFRAPLDMSTLSHSHTLTHPWNSQREQIGVQFLAQGSNHRQSESYSQAKLIAHSKTILCRGSQAGFIISRFVTFPVQSPYVLKRRTSNDCHKKKNPATDHVSGALLFFHVRYSCNNS